jgi:hypothetical protein
VLKSAKKLELIFQTIYLQQKVEKVQEQSILKHAIPEKK